MRTSRLFVGLTRPMAATAAMLVVAVGALIATQAGSSATVVTHSTRFAPKPTIVLVHGAWADSSGWGPVIRDLQSHGYAAVAAPNPLRGLSNDAATVADFLATISGPIVLVGHSYGGMVITNAATGNPNVKALVYDDAFIPDQGDTAFELTGAQPGSCLDSPNAFTIAPYPGAPSGDVDAYLKTQPDGPYPGFAQCFANGLSRSEAAVLAATQSPIAYSAGSAPSGVPAWRSIPCWDVLGTADHVIPPAQQHFMAARAHCANTEVNAGHLSLLSRHRTVTGVIERAAHGIR